MPIWSIFALIFFKYIKNILIKIKIVLNLFFFNLWVLPYRETFAFKSNAY